jgi:two-component system sensor histidine kinase KdpD
VGLGLTICRGIVAAHGGRMWAETRPGGGAAFHFTLPFTGAPMPPVPVEEGIG